jgi:hypothetical protein
MACHDVIGVLSTSSLTVRTCYLFFDQHVKLLSKIKVLQLKEYLNLQFGAFQLVEIELMVDVWIVHLVDSHSVIQVFFVLIVKRLIGCVKIAIPTLIFSNLSLEPGFLSG